MRVHADLGFAFGNEHCNFVARFREDRLRFYLFDDPQALEHLCEMNAAGAAVRRIRVGDGFCSEQRPPQAPGDEISGLAAPLRTATPMPERAMTATLPTLNLSFSKVSIPCRGMMMTSAVAPPLHKLYDAAQRLVRDGHLVSARALEPRREVFHDLINRVDAQNLDFNRLRRVASNKEKDDPDSCRWNPPIASAKLVSFRWKYAFCLYPSRRTRSTFSSVV